MISGMRDDTPAETDRKQIHYIQVQDSVSGSAIHHEYNKSIFWTQLRPKPCQQKGQPECREHCTMQRNKIDTVGEAFHVWCRRAAFRACANMSRQFWPTCHRSTANIPQLLLFHCFLSSGRCHKTWFLSLLRCVLCAFPTWGGRVQTDSCLRIDVAQAEDFKIWPQICCSFQGLACLLGI